MDLHVESQQLLESLSNSLLDRDHPPVFFSLKEIHLVERFLKEFLRGEFRKIAD